MKLRKGQIVENHYYMGTDNKPLKGKIMSLPDPGDIHIYKYWEVLWEGDEEPELCERSDFIVRRRPK